MTEENVPVPVSKPLVALGGLVMLLVLTLIIPARWLGVKPAVNNKVVVDFSKLQPVTSFTKDSNSDGMTSWKELVESTEGPDSPLLTEATKPDAEIQKALDDPNNLTSAFSKNLLISSAYLKNNNITDEDSQKAVIDGITKDAVARTISKKYAYGDIKVATKEDKVSIRAYGNEMAKIMNGMITEKNIEEDFPGVQMYLKDSDKKTLIPIQADAKRIDALVGKLLRVTVPPSAAVYHLMALNQIVEYKDVLYNLSVADTDPVRTAISIKKYPDTVIATLLTYKKLSDYFTIKNIVFTSKESGYVFTIGYDL
jgi:hypothetical protein